jgi:hypothetical protein
VIPLLNVLNVEFEAVLLIARLWRREIEMVEMFSTWVFSEIAGGILWLVLSEMRLFWIVLMSPMSV